MSRISALIAMAVLLSSVLTVQAEGSTVSYRMGGSFIERSLDGGNRWQPIRYFPSSMWLIWDPQSPEHVCVFRLIVDIQGFFSYLDCSWNAGASWYSAYLGSRDYDRMPPFANQLRAESAPSSSVLLSAYDKRFRLSRQGVDELLVEVDATLPTPVPCAHLAAEQVCANQALVGYPAVWFDPTQPGQGVTLVAREGAFWGFFTAYDESGDAHWYLFQFPLFKPRGYYFSVVTDLLEFHGPPWGEVWNPAQVQSQIVGEAAIRFQGPNRMEFAHDLGTEPVNLVLEPFQ